MADNKSFESTLHDIVYSIDTGTGLKVIRVGLYFLLLLVVAMVYTATQYRGLTSGEAMDFAQLGRNLSLEQGFVTKCVRPESMTVVAAHNSDDPLIKTHPDLYHPPAYPALLSLGFNAFKLAGLDPYLQEDKDTRSEGLPCEKWVIIPLNLFFTMLTGFFVFLLGKQLFTRHIGLVGMTVYFLSDLAWADAISGLNISMAVCFIVASFYAIVVSMLNKQNGLPVMKWLVPFFLSIVCAAIAFLTRYISIVALPGLCLYAWLMSGRFRGGMRYVIIFVLLYSLMIAPWLIRNQMVCGNPMGLALHTALYDTSEYPDNTLARDLDANVSLGQSTKLLKDKWNLTYTGRHSVAIPAIGGGILTALFLATFFYHFVRPQVNYLRWGVGVSLLSMTAVAGIFSDSSMAMLHAFWPFIILLALAFFQILLDRMDLGVKLYEQALRVFIVLLAMIPMVLRILPPRAERPDPPYIVPIISAVGDMFAPHEVISSDMPWATAWYGDQTSVLLPKNLDQFYHIIGYQQYISGIYFSPISYNRSFINLVEGDEKSWGEILMGRKPQDFPLQKTFGLYKGGHVLLSDRSRTGRDRAEGEAAQSAE